MGIVHGNGPDNGSAPRVAARPVHLSDPSAAEATGGSELRRNRSRRSRGQEAAGGGRGCVRHPWPVRQRVSRIVPRVEQAMTGSERRGSGSTGRRCGTSLPRRTATPLTRCPAEAFHTSMGSVRGARIVAADASAGVKPPTSPRTAAISSRRRSALLIANTIPAAQPGARFLEDSSRPIESMLAPPIA
jgi:hypothetical protein